MNERSQVAKIRLCRHKRSKVAKIMLCRCRFSEDSVLMGVLPRQVIERLHALADEAAATLAPIARPMWWLDPADEATFTIHDQFALGQDMIVAPVVERGAVTRNVYLTAGLWRDAFDQVGDSSR
jgi:hypothetical protein